MKNLSDDDLLELAHEKLAISDKHLYSSAVLLILVITETFLCLFDYISILFYILSITVFYCLHLYHSNQGKKCVKEVEDILKEFDSRGI